MISCPCAHCKPCRRLARCAPRPWQCEWPLPGCPLSFRRGVARVANTFCMPKIGFHGSRKVEHHGMVQNGTRQGNQRAVGAGATNGPCHPRKNQGFCRLADVCAENSFNSFKGVGSAGRLCAVRRPADQNLPCWKHGGRETNAGAKAQNSNVFRDRPDATTKIRFKVCVFGRFVKRICSVGLFLPLA